MAVRCLHDRGEIERLLRGDVYLHFYTLGNLDSNKWPYPTWYAWPGSGPAEALARTWCSSIARATRQAPFTG